MEAELGRIWNKPTDYKICENCGILNYYENKQCFACGSALFNNCPKDVIQCIEEGINFYKDNRYTDEEAMGVCIEV